MERTRSLLIRVTVFQKAEALATQRYDRDKLLALVDEVTTHFRMLNSFKRPKMRTVCRYIVAADQLCNSAGTISRRGFGRSGRLASIVAAGSIGLGVHAS